METTLKTLAEQHGMDAVLATLRSLIAAEAVELEEFGDPADAPLVESLEAIGSQVLQAAVAYAATYSAAQR